MEEVTVDEQTHDASTQEQAVVDDVLPPEEINTNDSNQDDDEDSLQTVSDLSLSREPFEKME
eukprot:3910495-Ditylum_brightwellii.AAC.1